jgi:hypothetical protein
LVINLLERLVFILVFQASFFYVDDALEEADLVLHDRIVLMEVLQVFYLCNHCLVNFFLAQHWLVVYLLGIGLIVHFFLARVSFVLWIQY